MIFGRCVVVCYLVISDRMWVTEQNLFKLHQAATLRGTSSSMWATQRCLHRAPTQIGGEADTGGWRHLFIWRHQSGLMVLFSAVSSIPLNCCFVLGSAALPWLLSFSNTLRLAKHLAVKRDFTVWLLATVHFKKLLNGYFYTKPITLCQTGLKQTINQLFFRSQQE